MIDPSHANAEIATFLKRLQWGLITFAALWVVWLLGTVLTPFVLAALLGWLGDPLVDKLERRGRSRPVAVTLVFLLMTLLLALALLILVPMIERQIITLVEALPSYREWFLGTALPWVEQRTGFEVAAWLDPQRVIELVRALATGRWHRDRVLRLPVALGFRVDRMGREHRAGADPHVLLPA